MIEFLVLLSSPVLPDMVTANTNEHFCRVEVHAEYPSEDIVASFADTSLSNCAGAYAEAIIVYGQTNEITLQVPVSMLDNSLNSLKYRGSGRRKWYLSSEQHCSLERNQGSEECKD